MGCVSGFPRTSKQVSPASGAFMIVAVEPGMSSRTSVVATVFDVVAVYSTLPSGSTQLTVGSDAKCCKHTGSIRYVTTFLPASYVASTEQTTVSLSGDGWTIGPKTKTTARRLNR